MRRLFFFSKFVKETKKIQFKYFRVFVSYSYIRSLIITDIAQDR